MNIFRKIAASLLIASILISFDAPLALGFSYPSPTSAMNQILSSMGVNNAALKNNVQMMNVASQKVTPPQVSLNFTPASPVAGSKITAAASPTYFLNDATKLYYTWYIQHNSTGGDDGHGNYDLNNDGRVNIEDYKIAAMRSIASGNFEWQKENYSNDTNTDSDSYQAIFGGDDQKGKSVHCFVHDFKTGNDYELPVPGSGKDNECKHLFPDAPGHKTAQQEDNHTYSFGIDEEAFWRTNPHSNDTANSGTLDEAAVAGLGKTTFSWLYVPGDKVGVAVEGISVEPTSYADSSYKTMWAMPKNSCNVDSSSEQIPKDDSTQTQKTTEDFDHLGQTVVTTIVSNHYSAGDYTVQTGNSPGMTILVTKTVTVTTQHYTRASILASYIADLPLAEPVTPKFVDANNASLDGTPDFFSYTAVMYPNPSEPTPTSQVANVTAKDGGTFDLNDCLISNLVEPAEGTSDKNLDVTLSYSPEAPINDSTGDNADELNIQSSVLNAENDNFINYEWTISKPESSITADFVAMTATEKNAAGIGQTTGIGLQALKLKLKFNQTKTFYIQATLRAKETTAGGIQQEGVGTVIIPIYSTQDKIQVFPTTVTTNTAGDSIISVATTSAENCKTTAENILCPVVKDEIVGLKTTLTNPSDYNLAWIVNGEPLQTADTTNGTAYFTVLQDKGSKYTVTLNASSIDSKNAAKIILTKTFTVTDPEISIKAINTNSAQATCLPVLLGHYVDPINKNPHPDTSDSSQWPDYSEDSFEALQGTTITLQASPTPASMGPLSWIFDGTIVTTDNASAIGATLNPTDNTLSFPADKLIGESYTIGVVALYTQSNEVKKALNSIWQVPLTSFYEKNIGKDITIKITDQLSSGSQLAVRVQNKKILASLFSNVPAYINFLFRIILTTMLILFSTGLLFSIFPKQNQD